MLERLLHGKHERTVNPNDGIADLRLELNSEKVSSRAIIS